MEVKRRAEGRAQVRIARALAVAEQQRREEATRADGLRRNRNWFPEASAVGDGACAEREVTLGKRRRLVLGHGWCWVRRSWPPHPGFVLARDSGSCSAFELKGY